MTLEDYAVGGANVHDLVEPFATRVLSLCDYFGGRLTILSGFRTNAEQWALYLKLGPGLAAYPGTSNHERGGAVDFQLNNGLTWVKVHTEAPNHGLKFPLPSEDWHAEADPAWTSPLTPQSLPEDDDMPYTPEQIKELVKEALVESLGEGFDGAPTIIDEGRIKMKLSDGQYWPLGDVLEFIHRQTKH